MIAASFVAALAEVVVQVVRVKVAAAVAKASAAQAAAEQAGEGEVHWAGHCKRVLRLSTFFRDSGRRWQMGVVLLAASIVDRLHWAVLGSADRGRLQLRDLVDSADSAIGKIMHEHYSLLDGWGLDHEPWNLLKYLGRGDLRSAEVMDFASSLIARQGAGMFLCAEQRLSTWPYRLWLMVSPTCSQA